MSGDRTTVLTVARCPNIVMRGVETRTWSEEQAGHTQAKQTNKQTNKQNTAATDLLVFLLQETIVPLVCGNPGGTLGWIHCDKFLQLLCRKTHRIAFYPAR